MSLVPIDEVVHFDVITSDPTDEGAAVDADAAPTYDVFEENTDTPILDDQTMTKRTSLTGNYRGSFTASAANGFEAGKWYSVVVTATVGSKVGKCVAKNFRVAPAESSAGVPKVDVSHAAGTAWNSGAIARATFAEDTGLQSIRSNTAQAGGASTITLDASASAVDDFYNSCSILTTGGTGAGQFRLITDYVGATKVATVDAAWATNPDNTTTFAIFPAADSAADIAAAVWSAVARTLTAGTNIVLAKGTGITGFNDLSAAQVNAEVDTALSDYDGPTHAEMEARTLAAADYATAASQTTIAGYIDTEVAAIIAAIAALNNISTSEVLTQVNAALQATIADSVPSDGTRPSISSGIYMLVQFMLERSVSGTTCTVRKPDGSTSLFTLTLNDASAPTSITRAT